MAYAFSGSFVGGRPSTFTPTFDPAVTGSLQVEFSRAPGSFAVNRYAQVVPVTQLSGYYLTIGTSETVRIVTAQDFVWPIGTDRPTGSNRKFEMTPWSVARNTDSVNLPYETVDVSKWDVVNAHMRMLATRMMTLRSYKAITALTTSGSYPSNSYFATAGAITGSGSWYTSTASNAYIQAAIQSVSNVILQNTAGVVRPGDIVMVMNPTTAQKVSRSPEVQSYVKNYGAAMQFLTGNSLFRNWGLPPSLWDVDVVVEDAVQETTRDGDTATRSYVLGDDKVVFCSRPGGLMGQEGAPTFSTLSAFVYEDFNTEIFDDPKNRRHIGSITDNYNYYLTAPISGGYIASVAS